MECSWSASIRTGRRRDQPVPEGDDHDHQEQAASGAGGAPGSGGTKAGDVVAAIQAAEQESTDMESDQ